MPIVTINGTEIEVDRGTTILRAAAEAGHAVPHFCYHPALSIPANCRMCLVEVDGMPKLQPGCYTQVNDGMVVKTESDRVVKARKAVLEFILLNHPVDCPICDQAGECKLQDYYVDYDAQESRLRTDKQAKVKAYPLGPEVVYDGERCILCTRCIRFCDEVTQTGELTIVERGDRVEIRTFPGKELDNAYSMCVVDLCPVGALTSRDFRFKCRVWLLTSTESVCTGCSNGCSIHLDHFRNEVQRYRPRYNPEVNDYWMCDAGRLSYRALNEPRLLEPRVNGAGVNWYAAADAAARKLQKAIDANGPSSVALVLSPQVTCESAFLARKFGEEVLGGARLFMSGKDDGESDDFLIKADKNPNRRGLEAVWGNLDGFEDVEALFGAIENAEVTTVYLIGSDLPGGEASVERFRGLEESVGLFLYQAPYDGGLAGNANIILPSCTHAEQDGTFVNFDGIAQPIYRAFAPRGSSLPDWQILMKLASAAGKPFSYAVLKQVQAEMFAASDVVDEPQSVTDDDEAASAPLAE